jgi:lipid II:glycine glycyltransferase (peptidoglycan interpeptide bridge formation enzyme)
MAKFSNGMIQTVGQIIYVDLSLSEDDIFAQMLKGHRRRIRKAVNNPDLRFETEITDNGPQIFYDIYTENMQRIQAHKKYFFSASFFKTAFRSLGKNLNLWQVTYKGDTCAVWITLKGGNLAYTWLSGVKTKYLNSNANNLLIYRSILKLKQEGFNYLIMGGGKSTMRDSLFDFKAGFSPLTKQFYVYKKIHLQQEYNRLIELQNYKGMSGAEFFPAYRLDGEIEDK